jgi:branched-chain amino acid transport system permease protein
MQVLVNGLISGATIALLALAFAVVYRPTRVFHIALAGIYSLVPFVAVTLDNARTPWPICAFVAILAGGVLSVLCEAVNHARLDRKGA